MEHYIIGIDVGGTKTALGLVNRECRVVAESRIPSDPELECKPFFDRIVSGIHTLLEKQCIGMDSIDGIGMGMPSFILYDEGYIIKTSALIKIKDFPARSYLSGKLGVPVTLDNDARAAGMAEYRFGAGRGFDNMLYCPVSTGISSALIINGKPFRGSYGWAGETGHMIATPGEGIKCGCGNRGCYMSWCSGGMIVRHIKNWITAGEKTVMTELAGGADNIDSIILEAAYDMGDPMAVRAFNQMIHWFGVWFYNLYVTFNVNCFVLGGGLCNMGQKFLGPIRTAFDQYNGDTAYPIYFKIAECMEHCGVLGAAELVKE